MNSTKFFFSSNVTVILGLLLIIFSSCKTNPPNTPFISPQELGKVFVTANITDAAIFVDNENTGKVTPDTIESAVGMHVIRLEKENYLSSSQNIEILKDSIVELNFTLQEVIVSKVVLLEDFANVSCIPCVTSNKIIETLINETYGRDKLAAIKYPTNFPSPVDPFYIANTADCNARMSYYSILIAPTTIIDGTERPISTDSISIKVSINQQLQETPRFSIEVKDSIFGSIFFTTVTVHVLDGNGLDFNSIVLHTVVTETDIEFVTPPGSNGETNFFNVMRVMLPSNAGESLSGINQSEDVVFQRQTNINSAWISDNLHTVAFIQNFSTKVVYQAGSTFE